MKIRLIAEFELPDEGWIEQDGDKGSSHAIEELASALFQSAELQHSTLELSWLSGRIGTEDTPKELKEDNARKHNDWMLILNQSVKKYEVI